MDHEKNNTNEWQLFHLAQALTRAKKLERNRAEYFQSLYSRIIYPCFNLDYLNPRPGSAAPDTQAIKLIKSQKRYDRKIRKEYERHVRWRAILEWTSESDKHIMIRYFQKKKYVNPKTINRILTEVEQLLEGQEKEIEVQRDEQAKQDYMEYMKNKVKHSRPVEELQSDKEKYLINGEFVYLTKEEYELHVES